MIHQRAARRRAGHPGGSRNFTGEPVFVSARCPPRDPSAAETCLVPEPSTRPPRRRAGLRVGARGRVGADSEPGEVVVAFKAGSTAHAAAAHGTAPQVLRVSDVRASLRGLRARPDVRYAVPNYKARIAQTPPAPEPFFPNDRGTPGRAAGKQVQWNFAGPFGVDAPQAWAQRDRRRSSRRPRRHGRRARHGRRLRATGRRTALPRLRPLAVRQGLRLRRPRPVPVRPQRPRHARRRDDRRGDQQRHRR